MPTFRVQRGKPSMSSYAASRATSLDVSSIILEALARRGFLSVDRRSSGRPAACRRQKPTLTIGRYVI
jgi:hypothetical protein